VVFARLLSVYIAPENNKSLATMHGGILLKSSDLRAVNKF
jgi:hypothetical protein